MFTIPVNSFLELSTCGLHIINPTILVKDTPIEILTFFYSPMKNSKNI